MFMTGVLCTVCVALVYLKVVKVLNKCAAGFKCFYLCVFFLRGHSWKSYTGDHPA